MRDYNEQLIELCSEITEIASINPINARDMFFKLPPDWQRDISLRLSSNVSRALFSTGGEVANERWGYPNDPILPS